MDKPDEWKNYAIRSGKKDRGAVVMAFLLLLFFQVVQIGRNEADFINALNDMFEKYTEKKWKDIDIGMPPEPSVANTSLIGSAAREEGDTSPLE